jgi:hypothetical protein
LFSKFCKIQAVSSFFYLQRLFGGSLFLTLYGLSLARLEIALSPFRFQAHNHTHLSIIAFLIIMGFPVGEALLRLLIEGQTWDCDSVVIIKGNGVLQVSQKPYVYTCHF